MWILLFYIPGYFTFHGHRVYLRENLRQISNDIGIKMSKKFFNIAYIYIYVHVQNFGENYVNKYKSLSSESPLLSSGPACPIT